MLYKTLSAAVYGIDANIIEVEVDVSGVKTNEDHFHTVGLPDAAVRESRDRVRAALKNCGYDIPLTHITPQCLPPQWDLFLFQVARLSLMPGRLVFVWHKFRPVRCGQGRAVDFTRVLES